MIFRFDDVCVNASISLHHHLTELLFDRFPGCEVMWAISPVVRREELITSRVYPKVWNALSDYREFYHLDHLGVPKVPENVIKASHGLVHVDHRLLTKEAQEMSIILSKYLTGADVFVPPFNKWNDDTQIICDDNEIELIKFEHGWLCMEHNKFVAEQELWYLHAREWTFESFKEWFND